MVNNPLVFNDNLIAKPHIEKIALASRLSGLREARFAIVTFSMPLSYSAFTLSVSIVLGSANERVKMPYCRSTRWKFSCFSVFVQLALAPDRQHLVLYPDVDVLLLDARRFQFDHHVMLVLIDVHRRNESAQDQKPSPRFPAVRKNLGTDGSCGLAACTVRGTGPIALSMSSLYLLSLAHVPAKYVTSISTTK